MPGAKEGCDLLALVADVNQEAVLRGILERPKALEIRELRYDIRRHPENDPGCRLFADEYLRPFSHSYEHALVVLDREGCGMETASRSDIESEIQARLERTGWGDRAEVVVIDPELESWVWSDSPHVEKILGWDRSKGLTLRSWLHTQSLLLPDAAKPERPKEAIEAVLRLNRKRRSSAIYRQIALSVSLDRCTDPAFLKLKTVMRR